VPEQPWKTGDLLRQTPGTTSPRSSASSRRRLGVAVHGRGRCATASRQAGVEFTADDQGPHRGGAGRGRRGSHRSRAFPRSSPSDAEAVKADSRPPGCRRASSAFSRCMVSDVELASGGGSRGHRHGGCLRAGTSSSWRIAGRTSARSTRRSSRPASPHEHGLEVVFFPIDSTHAADISEFPRSHPGDRARRPHGPARARGHVRRALPPPPRRSWVRRFRERIDKSRSRTQLPHGLSASAWPTRSTRSWRGADTVQVSVTGVGERSGNVPLEETVLALEMLHGVQNRDRLLEAVRPLQARPRARRRARRLQTGLWSATGSMTSESGSSRAGSRTFGSEKTCSRRSRSAREFVGQSGPRNRARQGQGGASTSVLIWLDKCGLGPASDEQTMEILTARESRFAREQGPARRGRVPDHRRGRARDRDGDGLAAGHVGPTASPAP